MSSDDKTRNHVGCIIELAAVVMGNKEQSCHLWDHLFSIRDISTDFVPGTMVE